MDGAGRKISYVSQKQIVMKLSSIHLALLDSAFDMLEEESAISIRFSVCFDQEAGAGNREFIVHSVNECESSDEFRRKLDRMVSAFLEQIHQQALKMDKSQCTLYMNGALERMHSLRNMVCFNRKLALRSGKRPCWVFHNPVFDCTQQQPVPGYVRNALLRITSPYAFAWKSAMAECTSRLRDMEFYLSFVEASRAATAEEIPHFNKMLIKTPVPALACFIYAASDAGLIHSDTKQQLYRLCCGFFCTDNAPEISPKSFRNHFDNPTPETLQETRNNLHLMLAAVNTRLRDVFGT